MKNICYGKTTKQNLGKAKNAKTWIRMGLDGGLVIRQQKKKCLKHGPKYTQTPIISRLFTVTR